MSNSLTELLDELFAAKGKGTGIRERADFLGIDRGTYTKLVNGQMPFTEKRARDFAKLLVRPDEDEAELAANILQASRAAAPPMTVEGFLRYVGDSGGAVPAGSITQLFKALVGPGVHDSLFCIEYRDLPRTSRGAKYADIGLGLGKAIADGLTVAMFMPFGIAEGPSSGSGGDLKEPSRNTLDYMRRVRDECRDLYDLLLVAASNEANVDPATFSKGGFLRLYERNPTSPYLGSGLGAKFGYVQYETEEVGVRVRHQKIVQWISAPEQDLIVYRGETQIPPDAIRDSLYPIPHYFHLAVQDKKLPRLPGPGPGADTIAADVLAAVDSAWSERHIPKGQHDYWQVYKGKDG